MKKRLNINEIKKIQLDILSDFSDICEENNLRYYLSSGTLLGAIRHQGFIPWDDDIDLFMPRKDYEKFISEYSYLLNENYKMLLPLDEKSLYTYLKIYDENTILKEYYSRSSDIYNEYGVYIDVFPMDGLPNENTEILTHFKRSEKLIKRHVFLKYLMLYSKKKLSFNVKKNIKIIGGKLSKIFYKNNYFLRLEKFTKSLDYDSADTVGPVVITFYNLLSFKKIIFEEGSLLNFEGRIFKGPKDPHSYLKQSYGDYMKLPKIEDRVSGHDYDVYLKYNSRKIYG